MERLFVIEQYIVARNRDAQFTYRDLFSTDDYGKSFGVRFYNQSPAHQDAKAQIERIASRAKSDKLAEFDRKYAERQSLVREASTLDHETSARYDKCTRRLVEDHSPSCRKCNLASKARLLDIEVHEWPLPSCDVKAKSAVFELKVPEAIMEWRTLTVSLLIDILSGRRLASSTVKIYYLHHYLRSQPELAHFLGSTTRIQLGSTAKPFRIGHYRKPCISTISKESVCKPNGLNYCFYDSTVSLQIFSSDSGLSIVKKCTPVLPNGTYTLLQYAVASTTHTSNEVLARQFEAPAAISLQEYCSFAGLRSGHRLQWLNIARELVLGVLNFDREETYTLVTQAAFQAGIATQPSIYRDSHVDLSIPGFCLSLCEVLNQRLDAVESNWQGCQALQTYAAIAARCVSMTQCTTTRLVLLKFLRRAKTVTLKWVRALLQDIRDEVNDESILALRERVLVAALTCYMMFDVEVEHVASLLHANEDIGSLVESSLTVRAYCPSQTQDLRRHTQYLLQNQLRVAHTLEDLVRVRLLENCEGLNNAIRARWAGYVSGSSWVAMTSPDERWLMSKTSTKDNRVAKSVHYNVLTGELLVDNLPISRLSSHIEKHKTYIRLFGTVSAAQSS